MSAVDLYTPYENNTLQIIEFLRSGKSLNEASAYFKISERNVRRRIQVYWSWRPNSAEEKKWRAQRITNSQKKTTATKEVKQLKPK